MCQDASESQQLNRSKLNHDFLVVIQPESATEINGDSDDYEAQTIQYPSRLLTKYHDIGISKIICGGSTTIVKWGSPSSE